MMGFRKTIQSVALPAGPALAGIAFALPLPEGLAQPAQATAAVALWMALWWMTEAAALAVTALLPLVLFPVLGIATMNATAASYAHPLIFLFFGGFLMARAMQHSGLSRRVAASILRRAGTQPARLVAGLLAATAFLSMWVSNTATAMMMLPVGQSIARAAAGDKDGKASLDAMALASALMLAIAYGATIGGMGTLIGTPPNALFAGFMAESHGIEIGFARWMLIGIPAVVVLLPIAWLVLTRIAFSLPKSLPGLTDATLDDMIRHDGPMSGDERTVAAVLLITAAAWMLRPGIEAALPMLNLSDAGIAVTAAITLFLLPSRSAPGRRLLSWEDARTIRWDVLILFGGGLALADAIAGTGLADWLGALLSGFGALPWFGFVLVTVAAVVLLGELASNTAIAAVFLPVAGAAAMGLGSAPDLLTLSVALGASLGFMLPVATPPNAIVYGSGSVPLADMLRTGALLDVLGICAVALLVTAIVPLVFAG